MIFWKLTGLYAGLTIIYAGLTIIYVGLNILYTGFINLYLGLTSPLRGAYHHPQHRLKALYVGLIVL